MIIDKLLEFGDAIAIALNIGNAITPNSDVIDTGAAPTLKDLGNGEPLYLVLNVDTAFVGVGATIQFQLCSDSTSDLATSKTVHLDTGALPVATYAAGFTKVLALPVEATYERYLGIWMTVATANVTDGKLNAFITNQPSKWTAYPDSTSIV